MRIAPISAKSGFLLRAEGIANDRVSEGGRLCNYQRLQNWRVRMIAA